MKGQLMRIVNELGDLENIEVYPNKKITKDFTEFKTESGLKCIVNISDIKKNDYGYKLLKVDDLNLENIKNVGYNINGNESQYKKTNFKELIKILKTVSDIVINNVKNDTSIDGLVFVAANKDEKKILARTDPQKDKLYKTIVLSSMANQRLMDEIGNWKLKDFELAPNFNGFMIYKEK